jgi:8-oxo-dGTP pyrophosphatase MutT (NUDIX family)
MAARDESPKPVDRVAAVCYRRVGESIEFILVRTSRGGHWTFPKGHIEEGEAPWVSARREALEEAGVRGSIVSKPFIFFPHEKHTFDDRHVELRVAAYLMHVESEDDPPELGRDPTWFAPEQAKQKLAERRSSRYQQAYAHVIDEACARLQHAG